MFLVYTGNITSVFLDYFIFAYICALEGRTALFANDFFLKTS